MRSILQDKESHTCFLCILLNSDYSDKRTEEHHVVFGTANRKLSEKYGLKVYLCKEHHEHDGGTNAVHRNAEIRKRLCEIAQRAFEQQYPSLNFREIFGKNYIDREAEEESNVAAVQKESSFRWLPLEERI